MSPVYTKEQREQMRKILQPEYAIGCGVITRDEYDKLKDEFFAQSELSVGLILPLILIVLGLKLMPQIGIEGRYWVALCIALVPVSAGLFWVGMERRNKFRLELELLIEGNWQRLQESKKQQSSSTTGGATDKIQSAVAKAIETKAIDKLNVDVNVKS